MIPVGIQDQNAERCTDITHEICRLGPCRIVYAERRQDVMRCLDDVQLSQGGAVALPRPDHGLKIAACEVKQSLWCQSLHELGLERCAGHVMLVF